MKKIIYILLLITAGCENSPQKVERNGENQKVNESIATSLEPIIEFRKLIDQGKIEAAKSIIDSFNVNYKDDRENTFFDHAVYKNVEIVKYLLSNGYNLSRSNKLKLFDYTKSDTTLFKTLYLPYVDDNGLIFSQVICNVELLNIALNQKKGF